MNPDCKKHFTEVKAGLEQELSDLDRRIRMLQIEREAKNEHLKAIDHVCTKFHQQPKPETEKPQKKL